VITDPITSITPPVSNLPDIDQWKISAFTNDRSLVGIHEVKITCTLKNYSTVAPVTVTFNINVIDNCFTAQLSKNGIVLPLMLYIPLTASEPTV
jgi:hypothetical protein